MRWQRDGSTLEAGKLWFLYVQIVSNNEKLCRHSSPSLPPSRRYRCAIEFRGCSPNHTIATMKYGKSSRSRSLKRRKENDLNRARNLPDLDTKYGPILSSWCHRPRSDDCHPSTICSRRLCHVEGARSTLCTDTDRCVSMTAASNADRDEDRK